MKFSINKEEKYTVLKLDEEKLDSVISPLLKTEFTNLNAEGTKNIIFDMSAIKYTDSSGLSAILVANRLCGSLDGYLILTGLQEHVTKLIEISQLTDVFNIIPTVEESIEAIFMNEIEDDINSEEA